MRRLALVLCFLIVAPAVRAADLLGVSHAEGWKVYGAQFRFQKDAGAPGGRAVDVSPVETKDPWSSGAVVDFKGPVKAGERYAAVFWIKAPLGAKVSALLLRNAPPYPTFGQVEIVGEGVWRRILLQGVAKIDAAPGENALSLHLGRAGGEVALGPAMILRGTPTPGELAALTRTYRPVAVAEDATIVASDGARLAATLRTPFGRGRFPVVLMIGGSGPQVRGGFTRLQDSLLAAGIATLEYDKRGCGQSTGERIETIERLAGDAEAALAWLRARRDIDVSRILVLGSSQGGVIAPAVAVSDQRLRGVVMQMAPAVPGPQVASDQVARQLSMQWPQGGSYQDQRLFADSLIAIVQSTPDPVATHARISGAVAEAVKAGRIPSDAAESIVNGFSDVAMRNVLAYRSADTLRRLKGPALAVFGTRDIAVSAAQNAPAAREALKQNPEARVVVLEGLNHFLQRPHTDDPEEWRRLGGMMSDPQAMNLIVAWIEGTLDVRRPR